MKNDRLFQLLYLLMEQGSLSAPRLAERLEVSVRTVYRDIDTLSAAGIPVYATAGKGGGISLMPGYSFDKALLSGEEQDKLLFAVQSLQAADQPVDDLLHKLGAVFHRTATDWIAVEFSRWGMHRTDTERFELLKTAILGKQVISLVYFGTSGKETTRTIHPLRLVYKDKNWYLQGYCLKANDFRLFKISRILEAVPTGESFAQDYSDDIPPLEADAPAGIAAPIKLRFAPCVAFRVYDEFEHSEITREPDGSLITGVSFPMDDWVISYLFSFGTAVEVLRPAELRGELAAYAQKIVEHYRT